MLTAIFLIAAAILAVSVMRPPRATWQRAIVVIAAILLLAVLIAWGIEFALQSTGRE
jgi:cell division protein FtsW (lipid II flippase)